MMYRMQPSKNPRRFGLPLLVLLLLLIALPVSAENLGPGGGTRIVASDVTVGPYRILLLAAPEPAVVGTVTFVARLSDPITGDKLKDVVVAVELTHAESGAIVRGEATHGAAGNALDYAAHLQLAEAGLWNGVLRVDGAAGPVELPFLQRVAPPRSVATILAIGLPFIAILGGLAAIWITRARRAPQEQPPAV